MATKTISNSALSVLRRMQQGEVDSHAIYQRVAHGVKDSNRAILERIASEELGHSRIWETYTKTACKPNRLRVWTY
ncbi:MAG: rubrerythrin family protein, partial [Fibrobacterota bacterium]